MKKTILSLMFAVAGVYAFAQPPVTSLNEDFNVYCLSPGFPATSGWTYYNPISATAADGSWSCTTTLGRGGGGCMYCTNTYDAAYHLDTSLLITPELDLHAYTDSVYLRFDSKGTAVHLGGRISVLTSDSTSFGTSGDSTHDLSGAMFPVITSNDSANWVTHQINITAYKSSPFYVGFRYISPSTSGNTWYLDNISITGVSIVGVPQISKTDQTLKVVGDATSSEIAVMFSTNAAGKYTLQLFNVMGQMLYSGPIIAAGATATKYTIANLCLVPGMYLVKVSNETSYSTARAIVH